MTSPFPETRWTQVERCRGVGEEARVALGELCAACHRPVHMFIRNWCQDEDKAKDLVQEFFARLLARPHLEVERGRGRFRSYLLGAVKHFLGDMQQAARTQKRGGGTVWVELGEAQASELVDPAALPPDQLFDQQWACLVLEQALHSLANEMAHCGRSHLFETLKPWLAGSAEQGQQIAVAGQLGISETAVRVQVHRMRKRYRELIETEVSQTLAAGADLAEEMQCLLAALAGR